MDANADSAAGSESTPPSPLPPEGYPKATERVVWNVLQFAPPGWRSVRLDYRAVGRHEESEAEVELLDGSRAPWDLPAEVKASIRNLRQRQSSPRGTWHRLRLTVEFPTTVASVEFDWYGEPEFRRLCPPAEYRRELYNLYAAPEFLPQWLRTRSALAKNKLSAYTWAPAEGVVPVPAPEPPVQVSAPVPEGILAALSPLLPEGWEAASYEVLALGGFQEHQLLATLGDGTRIAPEIPLELIEAVAAQRAADHTPERGAWLSLTLELRRDGESSMVLDYSTRPMWHQAAPEEAYAEELWNFPRADEAIPAWLRWRAGRGPAEEPARRPAEPRLRLTRETGTVLGERKYHDLRPEEIEPVAAYLRGGAAVLTSAAGTKDLVFPDRSQHVPLGFRTDGVWIWPEEVLYYLERDQASPDPALLKHIREQDYTVAEVPPEVLTAAYTQLTDWIEGPF
ncbi:MAG TPA: hypothetical protein VFN97_14550 [Actinospica sp.]|nr:hypothetical protein [Actinospica sp.]